MSALADMAKACWLSCSQPRQGHDVTALTKIPCSAHLETFAMPSPLLFTPSALTYRPWPFKIDTRTMSPLTATRPKPPPLEDDTELEEGMVLPVEPDEGTPLIPDDERVINVPS